MKNGGPAFPYTNCEDHGICGAYGMSLRDYFAAAALSGICAGAKTSERETSEGYKLGDACNLIPFLAAELSYEYADAMLAARAESAVAG